jgi:uncharacterized DUF497 family protein
MDALLFEWDRSNTGHLKEHDIEPEEAEQVIRNRPADLESHVRSGEERTVQIGESDAGRILVVVSTMLDTTIRVVTAWPAKERLRRYFSTLKKHGNVGRAEEKELRE